jgi:hypothetical protein
MNQIKTLLRLKQDLNSTKNVYIQYGCGLCAPEGWLNFDSSPNLIIERLPVLGFFYSGKKYVGEHPTRMKFPKNIQFGDIVQGLPVKNTSVKGIYASHVLEHLSYEDFQSAINNTFDLLISEGIFRLIVPDIKILAENYIKSSEHEAAISFVKETGMGSLSSSRGIIGIIQGILSNSKHLWMWDYNSIKLELEKVGFTDIRRAYFNDSEDKMFESVEDSGRFVNAVAVQCKKPI